MDGLRNSYSTLQNNNIPLEERIDLSREILCNSECFLPNKNQLLVDWSCLEISNIRRRKRSNDFKEDAQETELWKVLSEVLNDPASEQVVLRQKNLPLFFRELDEVRNILRKYCNENGGLNEMRQDRILCVFLCFQAITKNCNMALTFFNKLENLEQYLKGILTCFLVVLLQTDLHTATFVEVLFPLVVMVLSQYNTTQHQQVAQRKAFTNVCGKLLPLLLLVRTVLKDGNVFPSNDFKIDQISRAVDALIISGLFQKDLVSSYFPSVILQQQVEPSPKKPKLVNCYNQLFDILERLAKSDKNGTDVEGILVGSDLTYRTISTSLPFLLDNFLKATKDVERLDKSSRFSFFIELYNLTAPSCSTDGRMPDNTRMETLNKMLNIVVDYDVYQIAEDNANGEPIFKWFLCLMENELLSNSHLCSVKFQCLDIILKHNHKIIENSLETVLAKCFVKSEEDSKENEKAKVEFLCNLVEIYSKLQQLENLVRNLLKVVSRLGNELDSIPVYVLAKLSKSFEHCPFNQTLIITQIFLDNMKKKVWSVGSDGNSDMSIERISILFVNFLLNSSYNAADSHGLDEEKTARLENLVAEIKATIIMPLVQSFPTLSKTSQKEVGFAVLFLIQGYNSLILFLQRHDIIPTLGNHYVELLWDSKIEAYIPDESWSGLAVLKRERLRFCMELLAIQRARHLLLKQDFDQKELDDLVKCLYSFQDSQTIPELACVSWNFDPSCVNHENYPVAHWNLVTQYLPLLVPYCNENQLQNFAEFIVGTLIFGEKEIKASYLVTLHDISKKILKNGEVLSLSSIQTAVVKQLWKLLGEHMGQLAGDRLSGVFTWEVSDAEDAEMKDCESRTHERVNLQYKKTDMNKAISLAQAIAEVMDEPTGSARKQSRKKCEGNLSMVDNLLKILQRLPCHQFTPSNQVRCILGLLACDVLTGKAALDDKTFQGAQPLAVQLSCREITSTLLQGMLQHREFSAWHAIDMASLLSWLYYTFSRNSSTNPQRKFTNSSKELLRFAVILSMKSHSKANLGAITSFTQELVATLTDSSENTDPEILRCLDVLVVINSACTEFLEQKGKRTSSPKAACSIISKTMVSLASFLKSTLEENANSRQQEREHIELKMNALRLSGILSHAMALIPEAELEKNEDLTKTFEEWHLIVSLLVLKASKKMEDMANARDETITLVTVLTDVFKGSEKHCTSVPDDLRAEILRNCLGVLRNIGFPDSKNHSKCTDEMNKLVDAVLGLITGLLGEDGGKNCILVLQGVLEWSVKESEYGEDTINLLTGLTVFKDLVATKVIKQHKKGLRSILGKVMITLLSRTAMNVEISMVILEIVAALVTIGSGVFNAHDLALVFQALALKPDMTDIQFFSRIFMARFAILSWTLFYYPDFVYGAVHVFLPCIRELLESLLTRSARIESDEREILLSCVQKMSRLYQEMASHKNILSKYSIYFLADCVHVMSSQGVPGVIRDVLVQGVHFLFDLCNDDHLTKLHVYLPSRERELFRSLKDDYIKHHKFKGNA